VERLAHHQVFELLGRPTETLGNRAFRSDHEIAVRRRSAGGAAREIGAGVAGIPGRWSGVRRALAAGSSTTRAVGYGPSMPSAISPVRGWGVAARPWR
jgi:hypothetical protein